MTNDPGPLDSSESGALFGAERDLRISPSSAEIDGFSLLSRTRDGGLLGVRSWRDQRSDWKHNRPNTVSRELARGRHFGWLGGRPSDMEWQVSCSSELESMLNQARRPPRRGNAPRSRYAVEVGRPSARDESFFGSARLGETRTDSLASRRAGTSTATRPFGVTLPVDPEITPTAPRCGSRESGVDAHSVRPPHVSWSESRAARAVGWTHQSRGDLIQGNDGDGTRRRVSDLWSRLRSFGHPLREVSSETPRRDTPSGESLSFGRGDRGDAQRSILGGVLSGTPLEK